MKIMHVLFLILTIISFFVSCKKAYINIKNDDLYGYWESDINFRRFAGLEFINLLKDSKSKKWVEVDKSDKNLRIRMQFSEKDMLISIYSKKKTVVLIKEKWFIDHL